MSICINLIQYLNNFSFFKRIYFYTIYILIFICTDMIPDGLFCTHLIQSVQYICIHLIHCGWICTHLIQRRHCILHQLDTIIKMCHIIHIYIYIYLFIAFFIIFQQIASKFLKKQKKRRL